jgi:hypothetical protein
MTASSNERGDVLADVETKHVQWLLRILSTFNIRRKQFVAANYNEQARNFQSTLQFLENISWVREEKNELNLTAEGESASQNAENTAEVKGRLTDALIRKDSPYRDELAHYFKQFKKIKSQLIHQPSVPERLRESTLRNFLMDLGLVSYRAPGDVYVLEGEGVELYIWAANLGRSFTREEFRTLSERKEELGFRAELAVLDYEKSRVGVEFASRVEHISATTPFASYDIKSVSLEEGKPVARYIEVKAGPACTYQFYWTASEVEAARLLRTKYFLYVLPVSAFVGFDLKKMLIIQDPIVSVYQNPERWEIEENVILCKQKA